MATQPDYTPDELILMLDFVLARKSGSTVSVRGLSEQLRSLPGNAALAGAPAFRSPAGLATSLGYLTEIDSGEGDWPPGHEFAGRPSLRPHFKVVWRQFANDAAGRQARVSAIFERPEAAAEVEDPDFDDGFVEGRTYLALHRRHERSAVAVRLKKQAPPVCEVCGFDFSQRYGSVGDGFIECHHIVPLADAGVTTTRRADLALVCANCHRMLHRGTPPPTLAQLREALQ